MERHHAVVYIGTDVHAVGLPSSVLEQGIDVVHHCCDRFAIGDARQLQTEAQMRPVSGAERTFVIQAQAFTEEAQNALLKLFEEPPTGVQFFLVVPRAELLLQTLRSRVLVMDQQVKGESSTEVFAEFLQAPLAARLEQIARYAKEKDSAAMEALMQGVEQFSHTHAQTKPQLLRTVLAARTYFGYTGASRKMLLESIALSLPSGT